MLSSRVVSVAPATGEVREHVALPGNTELAGSFHGVVSAGLAADGRVLVHVQNPAADAVLLAVEGTDAVVVESRVSGFRLSDDGRFLAVGFSHPPTGAPNRIEVFDLVDDISSEFVVEALNAGPGEWSDDGRFLIVNEQWEDGRAWAVTPWSGSGEFVAGTVDPESSEPSYSASLLRETTCFVDERTVAYRTWDVGYGQGDAQPGSIAIRSLDAGELLDERGTDLFGSFDVRCHADGSVSYLRRPVEIVEVSPDLSQLEPVLDAPVELVRVAPDGTETVMDSGLLRFV